jgi:hypothetical protein
MGSQIWLEVQQRRELRDNVTGFKHLQPDHGTEVHAASIFTAEMSQKLYLNVTNDNGLQTTGMASECCGVRTVSTEKGSFFRMGKRTNSGVLSCFFCACGCEKGCLLLFLPPSPFQGLWFPLAFLDPILSSFGCSFECKLQHIVLVWNCLCIWSCDLEKWDVLMHYPVRCAIEHPHHTLPVILALANSYRDQEFTDGTKKKKKSEVSHMSQSCDCTQT